MAKVKRTKLAFIVGSITSFVWLWPVFTLPTANVFSTEGISLFRVARLLTPLLVWLLARPQVYEEILRIFFFRIPRFLQLPKAFGRLLVVLISLGVFPIFTGFFFRDREYIISTILPLLVSLTTLTGIVFLEQRHLRQWAIGIGFTALCFLVAGIITAGLDSTTYYTRPRVLMGFNHPTTTASAIIASGIFVLSRFTSRPFNNWSILRKAIAVVLFALFILLLFIAQNRNTLFCLFIGIGSILIAKKFNWEVRLGLYLLILFIPFLIYGFALIGDPDDPVWSAVNIFFSNRLHFYKLGIEAYLGQSWIYLLTIPIEYLSQQFSGSVGYRGFAATDSVYLSLAFNFGTLTLFSFLFTLLIIGQRLIKSHRSAWSYAVLCAVVSYFSMVPEGITASNLVVFVGFAYVVHHSINLSFEPKDLKIGNIAEYNYRRMAVK
jgi:hypothetical protein